jgi:hypothetical protein
LCRPLNSSDVHQEMENYQSWIRLTKLDVLGLVIFLLYLVTSVAYILARIVYSLDGLGSETW